MDVKTFGHLRKSYDKWMAEFQAEGKEPSDEELLTLLVMERDTLLQRSRCGGGGGGGGANGQNGAAAAGVATPPAPHADAAHHHRNALRADLNDAQAARKLQAIHRGFTVRKEIARQHAAAIKIQAVYRGKLARRTLQAKIAENEEGELVSVNQYKVDGELGAGAFAQVYKVLNEDEGGKAYAMKTMSKRRLKRKRVGRRGSALDNVQREIAIWKKLHHPRIVPLVEIINDENCDLLFLVSTLVSGGAVMPDAVRVDPLPAATARRYFRQLCEGIAYLHFQNIVHRDIKPGNLLIDKASDSLLLTDFGVARPRNAFCRTTLVDLQSML